MPRFPEVPGPDAVYDVPPEPPSGWQPIETAPRDGSWFMTYSPDSGMGLDFAKFEDGEFCKVCCGFQYATHWRPIPELPEEEEDWRSEAIHLGI